MGTIRNGANGGFSGKAGSIIGSSWNNINYIKGLPKLSKKPASQKQIEQRARFAAVLAFMGPIKDLLLLGYKGQNAGRATGFNMGIQHAMTYALVGAYPNYEVDKSLVQISKGMLTQPADVVVSSTVAGSLDISWSDLKNDLTAFGDDKVVVLLYNETQNFFMAYTDAGLREDGGTTLSIPANFSGQVVHTYLFYIYRERTKQSPSTYVAPIAIV